MMWRYDDDLLVSLYLLWSKMEWQHDDDDLLVCLYLIWHWVVASTGLLVRSQLGQHWMPHVLCSLTLHWLHWFKLGQHWMPHIIHWLWFKVRSTCSALLTLNCCNILRILHQYRLQVNTVYLLLCLCCIDCKTCKKIKLHWIVAIYCAFCINTGFKSTLCTSCYSCVVLIAKNAKNDLK